MRSYEVLRAATEDVGVKALAAELRVSQALVYKWCQSSDADAADASGARNPLDRVADIQRFTGDRRVIDWLCQQAGGFFVPDPSELPADLARDLILNTQRMVREFSQFLLTVTKSIEDDGQIEAAEAERIRDRWQLFKSTVEAFTLACESGQFHTPKS